MKKKNIFTSIALTACLMSASIAFGEEKSTHIKAESKSKGISVEAEIRTPDGMDGLVTSLADDSVYFENTRSGEWASFTCVTYMSAEEMEKAYDENNGDSIVVEEKHSVGESSEIEADGLSGSKRSVEAINPVTGSTERTVIGILPEGDGCLVVKTSVEESDLDRILSCIQRM